MKTTAQIDNLTKNHSVWSITRDCRAKSMLGGPYSPHSPYYSCVAFYYPKRLYACAQMCAVINSLVN